MKAVIILRFLFTSILVLAFFSSSYGLALGGNAALNNSMYAMMFLMISMVLFFKNVKFEYNKTLMILAILFVLTITISAISNADLSLILNGLTFLVLFLSTTVVANTYFKDSIGKVVVAALLISHIPILLIPLRAGIDSFPYRGIFDNSNAFGLVAATIFAVLLAILLTNIEKTLFYKKKPSKIKILGYIVLASLSFLLIVISGSRTSFLAAVVAVATGLFFIFLFSVKHKLTINLFLKTLASLPVLWILYWLINKFIPIKLYVESIILSKFDIKSGNTLSGRGLVWRGTLSESNFFGFGEGYFESRFGLGPHNTFIYVLGTYGWFAMIVFSLLILVSLYFCAKFTFSEHKYKYLPITMMVTFLMLSMGENLFHKVTFLVTFLLIGFAANNRKLLITS